VVDPEVDRGYLVIGFEERPPVGECGGELAVEPS
jgi:hypothetical protein